ncbi:MAG: GatB/YqeY domain-containing protein [Anaerolineae bacterium]|nr:GatB/YqeY domain-containing protein [Anaerolineae bacterium]
MSLKNELENAIKGAMKSGDEVRKVTLRMAMSAVKLAEVETRTELDDSAIIALLQKEVKSRREAIADAERAGRQDLKDASEAEIAVLEEFLPKGLSTEELTALVIEAIAEAGANSPAEMGNVMKVIMPKIQGRAEGGQVSKLVSQLLQKK